MSIAEFIKQDNENLGGIIEKYPRQVPVSVVADFIGADVESVRQAIESNQLGLSW